MVRIVKEKVKIRSIRNALGDFGKIQLTSKELLEHVGKRAEVTINIAD